MKIPATSVWKHKRKSKTYGFRRVVCPPCRPFVANSVSRGIGPLKGTSRLGERLEILVPTRFNSEAPKMTRPPVKQEPDRPCTISTKQLARTHWDPYPYSTRTCTPRGRWGLGQRISSAQLSPRDIHRVTSAATNASIPDHHAGTCTEGARRWHRRPRHHPATGIKPGKPNAHDRACRAQGPTSHPSFHMVVDSPLWLSLTARGGSPHTPRDARTALSPTMAWPNNVRQTHQGRVSQGGEKARHLQLIRAEHREHCAAQCQSEGLDTSRWSHESCYSDPSQPHVMMYEDRRN